jgi:predicted RNA-binding Zn-ribbon protein involved in translation (DUF1610 family)
LANKDSGGYLVIIDSPSFQKGYELVVLLPMKSFRLYQSHKALAPAKFVSDYKSEDLESFRITFQPIAEHYRHWGRIIGYVFFPILISFWLLAIIFPTFLAYGVCCFMVGCFALILLVAYVRPSPNCPACHNALDKDLGEFCPECGARAVHRDNWMMRPSCASCGKGLTRGKARHYTIRACTRCGVFLDDTGI